jgi:hypothetical protein
VVDAAGKPPSICWLIYNLCLYKIFR